MTDQSITKGPWARHAVLERRRLEAVAVLQRDAVVPNLHRPVLVLRGVESTDCRDVERPMGDAQGSRDLIRGEGLHHVAERRQSFLEFRPATMLRGLRRPRPFGGVRYVQAQHRAIGRRAAIIVDPHPNRDRQRHLGDILEPGRDERPETFEVGLDLRPKRLAVRLRDGFIPAVERGKRGLERCEPERVGPHVPLGQRSCRIRRHRRERARALGLKDCLDVDCRKRRQPPFGSGGGTATRTNGDPRIRPSLLRVAHQGVDFVAHLRDVAGDLELALVAKLFRGALHAPPVDEVDEGADRRNARRDRADHEQDVHKRHAVTHGDGERRIVPFGELEHRIPFASEISSAEAGTATERFLPRRMIRISPDGMDLQGKRGRPVPAGRPPHH